MTVTSENEVEINGQKYRIRGPVTGGYIDPFPQQTQTGGDVNYDNRLEMSSWVMNDFRGGIGVEEMDELIDSKRCWWTNCITDYKGHLLPPRKATAITLPTIPAPTIVNGDMELETGWTGGARSAAQAHAGTYSWVLVHSGAGDVTAYQDIAWDADYLKGYFTFSCWLYTATASAGKIQIDDGVGVTDSAYHSGVAGWEQITVSRRLDSAATRLRIILYVDNVATVYFDDASFTVYPLIGSSFKFANFNGNQYVASGNVLIKLASDRASYSTVGSFAATITALIPSLNSRLYIYQGDSVNYWYMSTAEAFTQSNSALANWGFQYDNKLFKCATTGAVAYSTDPDGGAPTWTTAGTITDIADQIQGFVIGRDASGAQVPYCATKSKVKAYDSATPQWIDTEVVLPDHPNGGKGATYYNGKLYFSYGLAVKEYYPESGSLVDIGLTERDGLPAEYNGEITKLLGDSGTKNMFAAVDASQVTGYSISGLYAYDRGWHCWWVLNSSVLIHDCDTVWSSFVDADVTASLDTTDFKVGSGSNKFVCAAGLAAGDYIAGQTITTISLTSCNYISFWLKSTVALDASDLYIYLDVSQGGTNREALALPSISANTWTKVTIALANPLIDSDIGYVTLRQVVDKGAMTINIDDVRAHYYDGAMTDIIVSSASSAYAVYFDHGGSIYYIDIPRGVQNPDKITQSYGTQGIFLSPWFDAGNQSVPKLAKSLLDYATGVTTTETVALKYRLDHTYTDLDTGWTTLDTLNTTGESGTNEETFASGAGLSFKAIQFRLDFTTAGSTAKADIQSLVLNFRKRTGSEKMRIWNVEVLIDDYTNGGLSNSSPKQKIANLNTAIASSTDVVFSYRPNAGADESYYVNISTAEFAQEPGRDYEGLSYKLRLTEA